MAGHGQFCAVARAQEILGGRWTMLIVRELLYGSRRFNDIRRGIPRISRTMLSERLQELVFAGAVQRAEGQHGPEYALTAAGMELAPMVGGLAIWGQRWLARHPEDEDLDLEPVLADMQRRVRLEALPKDPLVIRFEIHGQPRRFMLLKQSETGLCGQNPGFPEPLRVAGPLHALVAWWRGDATFADAQHMGLVIDGERAMARTFPRWFERYQFAHVAPAGDAEDRRGAAAPPTAAKVGRP